MSFRADVERNRIKPQVGAFSLVIGPTSGLTPFQRVFGL
jgi:hypothetical protein